MKTDALQTLWTENAVKTKTVWQYAKTGGKWVLGALLMSILATLAINVFDEDPSPTTRALLAPQPNRVADEDNLYLALLGFGAAPGESMLANGQKRVREYEQGLEAIRNGANPAGVLSGTSQPALVCKGKVGFLEPLNSSVWRGVDGHRAELEEMLNENDELYGRYLELHTLSGYYETETPSLYQEYAHAPKEIRSLFLAGVVLRLTSGQPGQQKQAMVDLVNDIRLWRTLLVSRGSLISSMIALANLQSDFLLLADATADRQLDISAISDEMDRALTLFDPADWKIGESFAYEFRITASVLEQLDRDRLRHSPSDEDTWRDKGFSVLQMLFFKKNATMNRSAETMWRYMKVANADPESMVAGLQAANDWREENQGFGIGMIYNPLGKVLADMAAPAYVDYAFRGYDAAALQQLARLGFEIRRQGITESSIPAFIQSHPEWSTHPISGAYFKWNPEQGEIALEPVADQPRGRRFSIPVFRRANRHSR